MYWALKMSQVWITVVHSKPTNLGMDVARKSSISQEVYKVIQHKYHPDIENCILVELGAADRSMALLFQIGHVQSYEYFVTLNCGIVSLTACR